MSADRVVDDPRFFREENDYSLSTEWRKRAPGEPLFNEAQGAIIDKRWELDKHVGIDSPEERKKHKTALVLSVQCLEEKCPYPGDMMLLAYETKLDPIKLRQWFGNQKSKLYKQGWEYDGPNIFEPDPMNAKRMWNEYKNNPRQYAKDLWDTKVCRLTGRRLETPTLSPWRSPAAWNAKFGSDGDKAPNLYLTLSSVAMNPKPH
ncbi:hypothetical protein LQW54_008037 [Pestalotiopsis sp. IQ-011]